MKVLSLDEAQYQVWEVDVKVDLFVKEDCWYEVCSFISHITVTSFPRLLSNNTINNHEEPDCLGKHFSLSAVEYITLHSRQCDPTALLCSDSKLRGTGVRRVFQHTLHTHTHTCIQTRTQTQNPTFLCFQSLKQQLGCITQVICNTLKLTGVHSVTVTMHTAPLLTINTHCTNANRQSSYSSAVQLWSASNAPQIFKTSVQYLHMAVSSPDQQSCFYLHKPVPFIRFKLD